MALQSFFLSSFDTGVGWAHSDADGDGEDLRLLLLLLLRYLRIHERETREVIISSSSFVSQLVVGLLFSDVCVRENYDDGRGTLLHSKPHQDDYDDDDFTTTTITTTTLSSFFLLFIALRLLFLLTS